MTDQPETEYELLRNLDFYNYEPVMAPIGIQRMTRDEPDHFAFLPNPHTPTLVDPRIASHHRARLLKRQVKVEAARQRQIHHEQKAKAREKRHERYDEAVALKQDEKERRKIEHDHRKEADKMDREERKRVKEVQRARRRSLKGQPAMSGAVQGSDVEGERIPEGGAGAGGRQRRQRRGHDDAIRRAEERRTQLSQDQQQDEEGEEVEEYHDPRESSSYHTPGHVLGHGGGVSWGFDPDLPDGGLEVGGPGREASVRGKGMGLHLRS